MTDDRPVDLAPRFLRAMAAGDTDGALALVHEEFELRLPTAPRGIPRLITGRDELADLVGAVSRTWPDPTVEVTSVHAYADDPRCGVAEALVRATNLDGTRYRNTYVVLVETADGLIRRWTEYYDPEPMVAAINALRASVRK